MWHHLCFNTNVGVITVGLHDSKEECGVCGARRKDNREKEKKDAKDHRDGPRR